MPSSLIVNWAIPLYYPSETLDEEGTLHIHIEATIRMHNKCARIGAIRVRDPGSRFNCDSTSNSTNCVSC